MSDIPSYVPTLRLAAVSTATTYRFQPTSGHGWALCTINDQTGELAITSDWGNWSHRWSTNSLGEPTLTHFIAARDACDYLADKLWGRGYGGRVFSAEATVKGLRHALAVKRLEQGRDPRPRRPERSQIADLTAELARELWDELGGLRDIGSFDLFGERFWNIQGHEWVSQDIGEDIETEADPMYIVLLHGILPALRDQCQAVTRGETPAVEVTPS